MRSTYRQPESSDDDRSERTVQSVSISRRTASRSARVNRGGRRSVARGRRRFESAMAQLEVTDRLRRAGEASTFLHGTPWHPAKIAGALVAAAAISLLVLLHTGDAWYVYAEDVQVHNLTYLDGEEIFRQSGVEGWNVLWLTPDLVQQRVQENLYVETASVDIHLPARLVINVQEMQPVALWVTNDATYWLTSDGLALPAIASTDETLPQLIDALGEARAIRSDSQLAVDRQVLASAMALMDRLPALGHKIRYNRNYGLNFPLPDQELWVYWGDGENTDAKLSNLDAAKDLLAELEEPASLIDVRFIHRPYVR